MIFSNYPFVIMQDEEEEEVPQEEIEIPEGLGLGEPAEEDKEEMLGLLSSEEEEG